MSEQSWHELSNSISVSVHTYHTDHQPIHTGSKHSMHSKHSKHSMPLGGVVVCGGLKNASGKNKKKRSQSSAEAAGWRVGE